METMSLAEPEKSVERKTLAVARRHVLGQVYGRCEHIVEVPVYLQDNETEVIGTVDESLGIYADAFVFHLDDQLCKRLAAGQYTYSFDYSEGDGDQMAANASGRPVKLVKIVLVPRKGYEKPVPRSASKAAAEQKSESSAE